VGIATTSLGLALIIRIREEYHTIEEHEIAEQETKISLSEFNGDRLTSGDNI
jgi:multicomponent Na+:H+ antiporter subunit C